jgi:hypothetical protein
MVPRKTVRVRTVFEENAGVIPSVSHDRSRVWVFNLHKTMFGSDIGNQSFNVKFVLSSSAPCFRIDLQSHKAVSVTTGESTKRESRDYTRNDCRGSHGSWLIAPGTKSDLGDV